MRVTLDTNTLASGAIASPGGTIARIIEAARAGIFDLFVSQHLFDELVSTLATPFFMRKLTSDESTGYVNLVRRVAQVVPITAEVQGVATHPEDDLVLATAVSGNADYLVTGDLKLQALGSFHGVAIVSPRAFLDVLVQEGDTP